MLRWCLVCVICKSNSFYSFIFKLCIMIVCKLKMASRILYSFDGYFLMLRGVDLIYFFPSICLGSVCFMQSVTATVFIPLHSNF